jgi:hypothetical protein
MSITLQLKSIERRLGVLLSSDSYVLQSGNDRVLKPLPPVVHVSPFNELFTLIAACICTSWSAFEPKNVSCVRGTLGGTEFDFCMNEDGEADGCLQMTYQLKTTDSKYEAPLRTYVYTPGQNQFNEIILYVSTFTSKFSAMATRNHSPSYWYP